MKRTILALPVLALAMPAFAQNQEAPKAPEPRKYYRLEFVVKEVEATKVLNSRAYSITILADERDRASVRTGTKIPIVSTTGGGSGVQYVDVGVNIDCSRVAEVQRDLAMFVSAEISSIPAEPVPATSGGLSSSTVTSPVIRQNRWTASTIVPLKKPTLIFSSDDPASKRQMQVEVTATPIL